MPWMSTSCCFRRSSLVRLELPSWLTRETFELRDTYTQFQDSFGVSYGASALGAATLNITDRFPFPCTMSGRSLVRGWKELLFVYSAFTAPASENRARPSSKLTTCLRFGGTCSWQAEGALIVAIWWRHCRSIIIFCAVCSLTLTAQRRSILTSKATAAPKRTAPRTAMSPSDRD